MLRHVTEAGRGIQQGFRSRLAAGKQTCPCPFYPAGLWLCRPPSSEGASCGTAAAPRFPSPAGPRSEVSDPDNDGRLCPAGGQLPVRLLPDRRPAGQPDQARRCPRHLARLAFPLADPHLLGHPGGAGGRQSDLCFHHRLFHSAGHRHLAGLPHHQGLAVPGREASPQSLSRAPNPARAGFPQPVSLPSLPGPVVVGRHLPLA